MKTHFISIRFQMSLFSAIILAILTLAAPLSASEFNQTVVRLVHFDVPADAVANARLLEISTSNGDIVVTGMDTNRVIIDADITVNGRKTEVCEDIAERVRIQIQRPPQGNDRLIIDPEIPRKIGYSISISYRVIMPSRLGVNLETTNGELILENSAGNATLESTNGSINAKNIIGDAALSSVNGSIFISGLVASKLSAETVNGQIECQCVSKAPNEIDISTVNGGIEVILPKGASASLSAETINGGLFIATGRGEITSKSRGSIEMSIGDGLGKYELSSINGSINLIITDSPD